MTSKVVRLLERAIEAVQEEGTMREGTAPTLSNLVRKARSKGCEREAYILKLVWRLVLAAIKRDEETHFETLGCLHDVVCEYIDDLSEGDEGAPLKTGFESKLDITRMN
jgi:hypothetical protein